MSNNEDTIDINKIIANVTVSAAESVTKNAGSLISQSVSSIAGIFSNTYKGYLETTYNRVSTIKTFINPQKPIDLFENYVPLNLRSGTEEIDDTALIEKLDSGAHIIVSALAGRGKSVLMKYIALSKYHNPTGTIPLFLELRHLNNITSKDILAYIHGTYKGASRLSLDKFKSYLSAGAFLLILDGFDEINPESRDNIEQQILRISKDYPSSPIIVTGRPEEKFNSWEKFSHYTVCPMTLPQVEKLIDLLDHDKKTKVKFIKRVKTDLYKTHTSFLSTPLLATLMLLTFEQYADIPDKVHIFYDNAFETLFKKHDALKEQYVRVTRSALTVDVFRVRTR